MFLKIAITLILCSFNTFAFGKFDFKSMIVTRSYPIAFSVQNDFGWGVKFWEANEKIYGYTRVSGILNASGVVNLGGARLEFFPISFLGVYAQSDREIRDVELKIFDCDAISCDGKVNRDRLGAKMALAFGPVFLMGDYQFIKTRPDVDKAIFADLQHSLEGNSNYDEVKRLQLAGGIKISDKVKLMAIYISQEMQVNYNRDFMKLAGFTYDFGRWELLSTAGVFKNRFNANVGTVLFALTWKGEKGLALF